MAVRFDASGDYLLRTANLPAPGAFAITGWSVLDADRNAANCFAALETGVSSALSTIALFTDSDGTSLKIFSPAGGGTTSGTLASLTVGVPFWFALVGSSTGAGGLTGYYRAAGSNTLSSVSLFGYAFTSGALFLGNNSYAEWLNGRIWNAKVWDRALSAEELLIESYFERPQFPASLNLWLPMPHASDVADRSGNGRNPTVGGTLATGDSAGQLWKPKQRRIKQAASGGGGVTGTLSATESGSDTIASSGAVVVQGVLSASESGSDTAALSGLVLVAGSLTAGEVGSDTASLPGTVLVSGTLAVSEVGSDTAAIFGSQVATGTLNATEAGSDTAALAGTVLVQGTMTVAETGGDTASIAGNVLVQGALTVTESGSDTFAASGSLSGGINGSLNASESGSDTYASTGNVVVSGSLAVAESGSDTAALSGVVVVQGSLVVTETGSDTFNAEGSASIRTGTMDAVESGSDTAEILGPSSDGSNLTKAAPGLTPKVWPGLSIRYEGKPKRRIEELEEEERERIEEIAEQAVIEAANERTKKAMKASLQASMRAAEIEIAAASYIKLVEQAALLRMDQIEEEDIAVALLLM